jgi:LacI family transcriptional regulator
MQSQPGTSSVREIATRAGVSATVVSAVLLGKDARSRSVRFSAATAARVKTVATELGYVPNRLTQSILRRESFAIAAISPWPHHDRYSSIIRSLALSCQAHGYHLLLEPCGFDHQEVMERLRALVALQVGAVVLVPAGSTHVDPSVVMREHQEKLAICPNIFCADWFRDELVFDCVEPDERQMVALPLRHLHALGHRQIGIIGNGTPRRRRFLQAELADLGLLDFLDTALAGFLPNRNLEVDDVPELTRRLLARQPRPTALYCWRDSFAASAYRVCEDEFGLKVGRDIALVGQDDTTLAEGLPTPLTSLSHRDDDFGAELYRLILARIGGELAGPPVRRTVKPRLVIRASSQFSGPERR